MKTKIKSFLKKSLIIFLIALGAFKVNASDTIQLVSHTLPTQLNVGKWLEFTVTYSSTNLNDTLELYGHNIHSLGDLMAIIGPDTKSYPIQATKDSIYTENNLLYTRFKIGVVFHPARFSLYPGRINNWILKVYNGYLYSDPDTLPIFPRPVPDSLLPTGEFPSGEILKTFERKKYDLNQYFSNPLGQDTLWTSKGKWIDTNYVYHISCDTIRDTNIVYINNWYPEEQMEPAPYDTTICNPIDSNDCNEIHAGDMPWYVWKLYIDSNTVYETKYNYDTIIETLYDTNYQLTSMKIDTSTIIQVTPYISVDSRYVEDTTYQKVEMIGFGNDTTICHPIYLDSCINYSDSALVIYVWEMVTNGYLVHDTSWAYDTTKYHIYDTSYYNNFNVQKHMNYYLTFWNSLSSFDGSYFNITENTFEVFADEYASPGANGYSLYMFIENDSGGIHTLVQIGYKEYLLAYLNQVTFENEAAPGDYWESRFNYGDIIQPTQDTIIIDGIPYWAERINVKYWIYKNQYLKSSNPDDPDSVWVNRAILRGTVPISQLKSSGPISHIIGAKYCKEGDCTQRQEYVLTISDEGVTTLEPLEPETKEKKVEFKIYPNPVSDWLYIDGEGIQTIELYDLSGQKVFEKIVELPTQIDVNNISSGIYVLKAFNGISTTIHKVLKQ